MGSANSFLGGERIIMWSLVVMQGMVMVQGMSFMWGVKAHRVKRQAFTGTPGEGEELKFLEAGIYNGNLKHGRPHGHGSIIYFEGDAQGRTKYSGDWVNGTRHGTGRTEWVDGSTYQGQYQADLEQGIGVLRKSMEQYEGEFKGGKKHGKGIFIKVQVLCAAGVKKTVES